MIKFDKVKKYFKCLNRKRSLNVCDPVGRTTASDTKNPRFKPHNIGKVFFVYLSVNCIRIKDNNYEKWASNGSIKHAAHFGIANYHEQLMQSRKLALKIELP